MKLISRIILLLGVVLLSSCGAEMEFSSHQCYFIFNTTYHPSTMLKSSITSHDGFCLVYKGAVRGTNVVYVTKYGETDPLSPYAYTTSVEPTVSSLVLGYDNGLLIGYSALENCILAFDRCCPRCEDIGGRLQWNSSSTSVKCSVCGTVYDLTIAGNGLSRYPASYDGEYLRVVRN